MTRVPPVVTVTDLADLLSDSADVVARIMPAVAATAGSITRRGGETRGGRARERAVRRRVHRGGAGGYAADVDDAALGRVADDGAGAADFERARQRRRLGTAAVYEQLCEATRTSAAAAAAAAAEAGGGDVTDALAPTRAAMQGFLAPPLMYLDPRGGTQPLSGLSMRPSIQQAGLHNMPGVQMPPSFADAVANGVNARAQRMSVNVPAGRPMPATMGDTNAEANVPAGGVEGVHGQHDQAARVVGRPPAERHQSGDRGVGRPPAERHLGQRHRRRAGQRRTDGGADTNIGAAHRVGRRRRRGSGAAQGHDSTAPRRTTRRDRPREGDQHARDPGERGHDAAMAR